MTLTSDIETAVLKSSQTRCSSTTVLRIDPNTAQTAREDTTTQRHVSQPQDVRSFAERFVQQVDQVVDDGVAKAKEHIDVSVEPYIQYSEIQDSGK